MLVFFVKFFLGASALIVVILVMLQCGKGGGLAGALGGMGGQSAFGTKAGDLFTKITIGVAAFWILISVGTAIYAPHLSGGDQLAGAGPGLTNPANSGATPEAPPAGKPTDSGGTKGEKGGKTEPASGTSKGASDSAPRDKSPTVPAVPSAKTPPVPSTPVPSTKPGSSPAK